MAAGLRGNGNGRLNGERATTRAPLRAGKEKPLYVVEGLTHS